MLRVLIVAFTLASISVAANAAENRRKIALLVGVADYFDKNMEDLSYAENDVIAVGNELRAMGFDARVLTGKDATREKVDTALNELVSQSEKLESDAIILLMFSGHGQELKTTETDERSGTTRITQTPFFCPRDAVPFDPTRHSLRDKDAAQVAQELNLVSLNGVISELDRRSNSRQNLLIVDACRNNPAKGKSAGITGSSAINLPQGISILFAAKSGQKSWESTDEKVQHGVMTHYLLDGLRGAAMNSRNEITWSRLVSHVRESVEYDGGKLAGAVSRKQTPHTIENLDSLIRLNDLVFSGLVASDWIQDKAGLKKLSSYDPETRYYIEFWPEITEETKKTFEDHAKDELAKWSGDNNSQVMLVFNDSKANIQSQLAETLQAESVAEVSVVSDLNGIFTESFELPNARLERPQIVIVDPGVREIWQGDLVKLMTWGDGCDDQSMMERQVATIGAPAPRLHVTHWFTDGEGNFPHETQFRTGQIYVVEIWATWCGPCRWAMCISAQLQQQYAADNVTFISVSDESDDAIIKYLDDEFDEISLKYLGEQDTPATYREAYSGYCVASDVTGRTWDNYMDGTGTRGFPHCVVVGRTGLVEWMGHTLELEEPLQAIVDDTWDRDAFKEKVHRDSRLQVLFANVSKLYNEEKFDDCYKLLDEAIGKSTDDEATQKLTNLRAQLSFALGRIDDECLRSIEGELARMQREEKYEEMVAFVWSPRLFPIETDNDKRLSAMVFDALKLASEKLAKDRQLLVYLSLTQWRVQGNQLETARKAADQAIALASEEQRAKVQEQIDGFFTWRKEYDESKVVK